MFLTSLLLKFLRKNKPNTDLNGRLGDLNSAPVDDIVTTVYNTVVDIRRLEADARTAAHAAALVYGGCLGFLFLLVTAVAGWLLGSVVLVVYGPIVYGIMRLELSRMRSIREHVRDEFKLLAIRGIVRACSSAGTCFGPIIQQALDSYLKDGPLESASVGAVKLVRDLAVGAGCFMVATGNDAGFKVMGLANAVNSEAKLWTGWIEAALMKVAFPYKVATSGVIGAFGNSVVSGLRQVPVKVRHSVSGSTYSRVVTRSGMVAGMVGAALIGLWFVKGNRSPKPFVKPRAQKESEPVGSGRVRDFSPFLRKSAGVSHPGLGSGPAEARKGKGKNLRSQAINITNTKSGGRVWEYEGEEGNIYVYLFENRVYDLPSRQHLSWMMNDEGDDFEAQFGDFAGDNEASKGTIHQRKETRKTTREKGPPASNRQGGIQFGSVNPTEIVPELVADPELLTQGVVTEAERKHKSEGRQESALGGMSMVASKWCGGVVVSKANPNDWSNATFMSGKAVLPTHLGVNTGNADEWELVVGNASKGKRYPITGKVLPLTSEDRLSVFKLPNDVASTKLPRGRCEDDDRGVLLRFDSVEAAESNEVAFSAGEIFAAPRPGELGRHRCPSYLGNCGGAVVSLLANGGGKIVGIHSNGDNSSGTNGYVPFTEAVLDDLRTATFTNSKN